MNIDAKGAQIARNLYPGLRSGLIVPGLDIARLEKASKSDGDVMHIELEDGVPPKRKAEGRKTITEALQKFNWSGKLTLIRINAIADGFVEDDVDVVSQGRPTAFMLGKCEGPEDIQYLDHLVTRAEKRHGLPHGSIKLASMIERVRALQKADDIATASPRMMALYIGPTDLSTEVGYRRTYRGQELEVSWVRSRVVFAAHAAGILAIDSPTPHYKDLEETAIQARWSYQLGFDAKTCISPRQLETVNRAFSPTEEEISWAEEVFADREKAEKAGESVWVNKQGMMVDDAMIVRSHNILQTAKKIRKTAA
jgi:citrate lyase subunit beta/citryl-CoA lyase